MTAVVSVGSKGNVPSTVRTASSAAAQSSTSQPIQSRSHTRSELSAQHTATAPSNDVAETRRDASGSPRVAKRSGGSHQGTSTVPPRTTGRSSEEPQTSNDHTSKQHGHDSSGRAVSGKSVLDQRPPWTRFITPRAWDKDPPSTIAVSTSSAASWTTENDANDEKDGARDGNKGRLKSRDGHETVDMPGTPPRWMPSTRPASSPKGSSSGTRRRDGKEHATETEEPHVVRTPPRPVSAAWRSGDAAPSRPRHVDDFEMLEVQVCQWSYLCTYAERAFNTQEAEASAMIAAAARHLQAMRASAHDAGVEVRRDGIVQRTLASLYFRHSLCCFILLMQ